MVDVLLLASLNPRVPFFDERLGLSYLAASLRKGNISTVLLDEELVKLSKKPLSHAIIGLRPKLVGLSATGDNLQSALRSSRLIRSVCPGTIIILGGPQASLIPRFLVSLPNLPFDLVIQGDAEEIFPKLVKRLLDGCGPYELASSEKGVWAISDYGPVGHYYVNRLSAQPSYPPARDLMKARIKVKLRSAKPTNSILLLEPHDRVAHMVTARGCPYSCTFCSERTRAWDSQTAHQITDELAVIMDEGQLANVTFWDPQFLGSSRNGRARIEKFVDLMEKRSLKVPFKFAARADSFDCNGHLLKKLTNCGFWCIYVGLEHWEQESLSLYRKNTTPAQNKVFLQSMDEHGIYAEAGFIMFHPLLTKSRIIETIDAAERTGFGFLLTKLFSVLRIDPSAPITKALLKKKILRNDAIHYSHPHMYTAVESVSNYYFIDEKVGRLARLTAGARATSKLHKVDFILQSVGMTVAYGTRTGLLPFSSWEWWLTNRNHLAAANLSRFRKLVESSDPEAEIPEIIGLAAFDGASLYRRFYKSFSKYLKRRFPSEISI